MLNLRPSDPGGSLQDSEASGDSPTSAAGAEYDSATVNLAAPEHGGSEPVMTPRAQAWNAEHGDLTVSSELDADLLAPEPAEGPAWEKLREEHLEDPVGDPEQGRREQSRKTALPSTPPIPPPVAAVPLAPVLPPIPSIPKRKQPLSPIPPRPAGFRGGEGPPMPPATDTSWPYRKRRGLTAGALGWVILVALLTGGAISYVGLDSRVLSEDLRATIAKLAQEVAGKVDKEGSRLSGPLFTNAPVSLEGTNSTLSVDGTTILQGPVTIETNLDVKGEAVIAKLLSGDARFTGTFVVEQVVSTQQLQAGSVIADDLTVGGDRFRVAAGSGDTVIKGTLTVEGVAQVLQSLSVSGLTTTKSLVTNGSHTVNGSSQVNGPQTVTGLLQAVGGISAGATTLSSLSVSGAASVGGTLGVTGATTLGTLQAGSSTLSSLAVTGSSTFTGNVAVDGRLTTNLTPADGMSTLQLGTAANYWGKVYVNELIANNISAGNSAISGTVSSDFTINSDNATADGESMNLIFYRGTTSPNAVIGWDNTNDRFTFNQATLIQNASDSINAFQIQRAGGLDAFGFPVMAVDTTASLVGVSALKLFNSSAVYATGVSYPLIYSSNGAASYPFNAAGHLIIQNRGDAQGDVRDILIVTGQVPTPRIVVTGAGQIQLQTAIGAATALVFGGDANLYRSAANELATDDLLRINHASGLRVGDGVGGYIGIEKESASGNLTLVSTDNLTRQIRFVVNGDPKITFGSTGDTNLYRAAADILQTDDRFIAGNYLQSQGQTAGSAAFRALASGDPQHRFQIDNTGRIDWGPGSGATDTNLYRSAANQLTTDDDFTVFSGGTHTAKLIGAGGQFRSSYGTTSTLLGYTGLGAALQFGAAADTYDVSLYRSDVGTLKVTTSGTERWQIDGNAIRYIGTGSGAIGTAITGNNDFFIDYASAGNLYFRRSGTSASVRISASDRLEFGSGVWDTNLYRSAASQLKTDDSFWVGDASNNSSIEVWNNIGLGKNNTGQILFGSAFDTNLYRSAANTLKTDDYLQSALSITAARSVIANEGGTGIGFHYNPATATGNAFVSQIGADANGKFYIQQDGRMLWGAGGASATDTTLYRDNANSLKTDDNLTVVGTAGGTALTVGGTSSPNRLLTADDAGRLTLRMDDNSSQNNLTLANAGIVAINQGAGMAFDLGVGNSRVQAGSIRMLAEDTYALGANRDSYLQFSTSLDGSVSEKLRITSAGRILFEADTVANLYRSGAGALRTDGTLDATTLQQAGTAVLLATSAAGGDLSGTLANLQLGSGVVTTTEILNGTILSEDIQDGTIANIDIATNAAIAVSKLASGSDGQVLTIVGGVPTWATPLGTPTGAVMYFNLASCPSGWTELTGARGRYLVGLPASGTLAGTAGTALTNLEDRPVGQHNHSGTTNGGGSHAHGGFQAVSPTASTGGTGYTSGDRADVTITDAIGDHTHGFTTNNTGGVAGTNAPYLQLLVCQKD